MSHVVCYSLAVCLTEARLLSALRFGSTFWATRAEVLKRAALARAFFMACAPRRDMRMAPRVTRVILETILQERRMRAKERGKERD